MTIEGLLSANDETIARAIISVKKKKGDLYKVGDEIKGANAVVEEIREDSVLLNRNGVIENLAFVKKTISGNRSITSFPPTNPYNRTIIAEQYNRPSNNLNRPRPSNNNQVNNNKPKQGATKRIKRPNFKGLDAALERELDATIEKQLEIETKRK